MLAFSTVGYLIFAEVANNDYLIILLGAVVEVNDAFFSHSSQI